MERKTRNKIYHVMSVAFIIAALTFSVFRFTPVFFRTVESLKDLGLSLAYFPTEFFAEGLIEVTVTEISPGTLALLPITWEEFKAGLVRFCELFVDKANFKYYFFSFLLILVDLLIVLATLIELVAVGALIAWMVYSRKKKKQHSKKETKRKGKRERKDKPREKKGSKKKAKRKRRREVQSGSTKPYAAFFRFRCAVLDPVVYFFKRYKNSFLKRWKGYKVALILIWLYNLNVFTVIIEAFAYLFYIANVVHGFDFKSLPIQLFKLVLDLSVPILFLPIWVQAIIGYKIFHAIRCWIGKTKLRAYVKKITGWLDKILGSIFINGKQRARKTTLLTVLAVCEAIRQRKRVKKRLKERAKQFPHFPWRNVEKTVRKMRDRHTCYSLASTREFIRELRGYYDSQDSYLKEERRQLLRNLRRRGYVGDNFIFGYKFKKFPTSYIDGVRVVELYECIEIYARLYFIYTTPTPLVFGNYSIRCDETVITRGNFEKYNLDFFNRKPENMKKDSQYSHYAIGDSMRLGKLMDPFNPYKDALEYGVVAMTEFEKEVGNQHTNGAYKVDASGCNRKNDGLSNFLKTCTHMATVGDETVFRFMCDGHRPGSMAADYAELCTLWRVKKCSETKIVLPFFGIEGAICEAITKGYDWLEEKMSFWQAKRTLFMYFVDVLYGIVFRHYDRIRKQYGVYTTTIDMWDGADSEMLAKGAKLPIPEWLAFGDRFATDAWGEFFHEKSKRSKYGINDVPMFKDKKMSFEEMQAIGSHIYNEMGELMHVESFVKARQERDKWLKEEEQRKKDAAKTKE